MDEQGDPGSPLDAAGFCTLMDDMSSSFAAARESIQPLILQSADELNTTAGISLLSLKHHLLLSYLQSLALVGAHRAIGHSLSERSPPTEPFSQSQRGARGADGGDLVDSMVEARVALEKIKALEARLRYQIEKLVRTAQESDKASTIIDDPLAFRPNPQNLLDNDGDESGDDAGEQNQTAADDGIYRPPRLAPVPYDSAPPKSKRERAPPVPSALRNLVDSSMPHAETTSGLGVTPSLQSSRARHLKRIEEFEEENFTRVVMGKTEAKRRARDEADLALGADLGGGRASGKNRRRGGFEDEFSDVLRSVDRGSKGSRGGGGDGYDELRKRGQKKNVLERSKVNARAREEETGDESEARVRKKSRFEQATKVAKRKLKR